jgi:hypothetical protein
MKVSFSHQSVLFEPLLLFSKLLKKESILIDPHSLQTFIFLDIKRSKVNLSENLKVIPSKDQLSLGVEEQEQKNELLKTTHLKLLDQSDLLKEVTSSIVDEKEKLATAKKPQAFLEIADYSQNLACSDPKRHQILNQIIANQQLAIDDQGQALVVAAKEEGQEKENLIPLKNYFEFQGEFNQELTKIVQNSDPVNKFSVSFVANHKLNFINLNYSDMSNSTK